MKIGYARVSTEAQDIAAQRERLLSLGVSPDRIYSDHGLSGRTRRRPGLETALAVCRHGDELVVNKLDRLARSVQDAVAIFSELESLGVALNIDGVIYDPKTPTGKLMLNILSMIAEFEADLISARTKEGMTLAKKKGRLRGKSPKLSKSKQKLVREMWDEGTRTQSEIAEIFQVSPRTIRRIIHDELKNSKRAP